MPLFVKVLIAIALLSLFALGTTALVVYINLWHLKFLQKQTEKKLRNEQNKSKNRNKK